MTRQNRREACSRRLRQLSTTLLLALSVVKASFAAAAQPAEVVVRIEVTDRSEETIAAAAREALQQTLLLRSGDRDLLAHPTISATLDDARSQLSLYQFEQIEGRTRFVAQIDLAVIDNLIREADGTMWTASRPPVLMWLVVDDIGGRRFGNTDN